MIWRQPVQLDGATRERGRQLGGLAVPGRAERTSPGASSVTSRRKLPLPPYQAHRVRSAQQPFAATVKKRGGEGGWVGGRGARGGLLCRLSQAPHRRARPLAGRRPPPAPVRSTAHVSGSAQSKPGRAPHTGTALMAGRMPRPTRGRPTGRPVATVSRQRLARPVAAPNRPRRCALTALRCRGPAAH